MKPVSKKRGLAALLIFLTVAPTACADEKGDAKPAASRPRPRVTISKETTVITEPLRDDGYPDYTRYLNEKLSQGVTPENNAMVALLEAIGPAEIGEQIHGQFFTELGIPPLPNDGDYLEGWNTFAFRVPENERPAPPPDYQGTAEEYFLELDSFASSQPWTAKEFPHLARWLEWQNQRLDKLVGASRRSRFYSPFVSDANSPSLSTSDTLPTIGLSRGAATWLLTRAMFRIGEKNVSGATDDIFAVRRLARLLATRTTLIDLLVGFAIDGMAVDAQVTLLTNLELSRDQLARLRKLEYELPPISPAWKNLTEGERLWFADAVCVIAETGGQGLQEILIGQIWQGPVDADQSVADRAFNLLLTVSVDWDFPLRRGNQWYDRCASVGRINDPREQRAAIGELEREVNRMTETFKKTPSIFDVLAPRRFASDRMADALVAGLAAAITGTYKAENRMETRQNVLRIAIALHEYRAKQRKFPVALNDLKGKFLETIPVDAHTASAFAYKRSENGYLLYSLGQNGRDDQGENDGDEADDIAIRVPVE